MTHLLSRGISFVCPFLVPAGTNKFIESRYRTTSNELGNPRDVQRSTCGGTALGSAVRRTKSGSQARQAAQGRKPRSAGKPTANPRAAGQARGRLPALECHRSPRLAHTQGQATALVRPTDAVGGGNAATQRFPARTKASAPQRGHGAGLLGCQGRSDRYQHCAAPSSRPTATTAENPGRDLTRTH